MIVASALLVVCLSAGAVTAYADGLRLGGVVTVSLIALYTLINVYTLPLFLVSAAIAFGGMVAVRRRWLLYGRGLFLFAIGIGALVPVLVVAVWWAATGGAQSVTEIEFVASILPGIAAYNVYRQKPELRAVDIGASLALLGGVLLIGGGFAFLWMTPPCTLCSVLAEPPVTYAPSVLFGPESDLASVFGVVGTARPSIGSLPATAAVMLVGFFLSEYSRYRWQLRPVGVVALPLLALFALRTWRVLPLYLVALAVAYVVLGLVHRRTFLYGRVLLSAGMVVGIVVGVPATVVLGVSDGLSALFTVILGGIGGYNLLVVTPRERPTALLVSAGIFAVTFVVARALVTPLATRLAVTVEPILVVLAVVLLALSGWMVYGLEGRTPDNAAIRDASVFARGEDGR